MKKDALEAEICRTTVIESRRLSNALGARIILASEAFQHTGSFKFRAAYNVVPVGAPVPPPVPYPGGVSPPPQAAKAKTQTTPPKQLVRCSLMTDTF